MQQEVTVSVNDILRFIGRGLLPALLVAAAAGFAVYQLSQRQPEEFTATSVVLSSQAQRNLDNTLLYPPPLDASAYAAAIKSDRVLEIALDSLTDEEVTQGDINGLRSDTRVQPEEDRTSSLLNIRVESGTAEGASARANALARAVVVWDRSRATSYIDQQITSLDAQIEAISEQIREFQTTNASEDQIQGQINLRAERFNSLNQARVLREAASPLTQVLNLANVPGSPTAPNPLFDATLAALLGIVLTYGLLLLRNALDTRLRTVDDIAEVSGLPVIAEFPKLPKGVRNLPREASSYLRTNILFSAMDADPKVILVTSANSEEGKSSIAISLSESFVRNGYRTLLVDADLRKPVVAGEYRINSTHQASLEDCLKNPHTAHKAATVSISAKDYLYVVPTFQPTPQASELLSRGFRECLERWRQEYDVIIVDSAPVLAVADALAIAPLATGTLLAINQQKTDRRQVRSTVELLRRIGVRMLGIAVTHVSKETAQQSRYSYGYGYAETEASGRGEVNPKDTLVDSPRSSTSRVES